MVDDLEFGKGKDFSASGLEGSDHEHQTLGLWSCSGRSSGEVASARKELARQCLGAFGMLDFGWVGCKDAPSGTSPIMPRLSPISTKVAPEAKRPIRR